MYTYIAVYKVKENLKLAVLELVTRTHSRAR